MYLKLKNIEFYFCTKGKNGAIESKLFDEAKNLCKRVFPEIKDKAVEIIVNLDIRPF